MRKSNPETDITAQLCEMINNKRRCKWTRSWFVTALHCRGHDDSVVLLVSVDDKLKCHSSLRKKNQDERDMNSVNQNENCQLTMRKQCVWETQVMRPVVHLRLISKLTLLIKRRRKESSWKDNQDYGNNFHFFWCCCCFSMKKGELDSNLLAMKERARKKESV